MIVVINVMHIMNLIQFKCVQIHVSFMITNVFGREENMDLLSAWHKLRGSYFFVGANVCVNISLAR